MRNGRALAGGIFANESDPSFRRRAHWIGDVLSNHFPNGGFTLLDIGCGQGFYLPLYAALGAIVTGVEFDEKTRNAAIIRAAATGATIVGSRAEALPFGSASFDVVVMSEILEHLETPGLALAEAYRVLSADGILIVTVPNEDYPFFWDPINFVLEQAFGKPIRHGSLAGIWANHVRLYNQHTLKAEIQAAQFEVADIFTHTSHCFPFIHNLVYGLGKPLLERNILPDAWARSAVRAGGKPQGINPVGLAISLIQWADRRNSDREHTSRRAQNICLLAHKVAV